MNGDVKFIQGVLYHEWEGKWYPVQLPVASGGRGARGAQGIQGIQGESGAAAPSFQATAIADDTTDSLVDVVADGMTLTPPAGTYLVWFSGSTEGGGDSDTFVSIWANGVQVPSSEEKIISTVNNGTPFNSVAKVTVDGTQTIEGRWRVNGATAVTMHQRNLTIIQVAP